MADLDTSSRFEDPDAAFHVLVDAHRALDAEQSARFNARLVLLFANHIGDMDVLKQAVDAAKRAGE
jgi:Protein of unknown function (DUF2783)